jgi:hypothetical protein
MLALTSSLSLAQECSKNDAASDLKVTPTNAVESAEKDPTLWKWSGNLDELANRFVPLHPPLVDPEMLALCIF